MWALGSYLNLSLTFEFAIVMIILGVHPGYHESAACVFDNYRMIAAVSQERLTRRKIDGGRVPIEAIDECLKIAGIARKDVDSIVLGRGAFPWRYFNHFKGPRYLEGRIRYVIGKEKYKSMGSNRPANSWIRPTIPIKLLRMA